MNLRTIVLIMLIGLVIGLEGHADTENGQIRGSVPAQVVTGELGVIEKIDEGKQGEDKVESGNIEEQNLENSQQGQEKVNSNEEQKTQNIAQVQNEQVVSQEPKQTGEVQAEEVKVADSETLKHQTPIDFASLSEQQKNKMLQQQALLSSLYHSADPHATLYQNMTVQQRRAFKQKRIQQARKSYQKAMQQLQQRTKRQQQQMDRMMASQQLSMTQQINHRQSKQFKQRQDTFNPRLYTQGNGNYYRHQFHQYMFELDKGQEADFGLSLPVAQDVAFFIYSYTNKNGVYSLTTEINNDPPPAVSVIQNNHLLLKNQTFYFRKYIIFAGKQHYSYVIRIKNDGEARLFAMSVVHLLQRSHISSAMASEDLISHQIRAQNLYQEISMQVSQRNSRRAMYVLNQAKLSDGIKGYYVYSLVEMVIVLGGCLLQVKVIEKLLTANSIV